MTVTGARQPATKLTWTDWRGKEQVREINHVIDVRDFLGTPGYSQLVVAANTHLSVADIERLLDEQAIATPYVFRPRSWIQRRRWLFQQPGTVNASARSDRDGKDNRAIRIMRDNPRVSLRSLALALKENGIARSREWIRRHRCD